MLKKYQIKLLNSFFIIAILHCICANRLQAQTTSQTNELITEITQLQYINPEEAIKIGKHLLNNTEDPKILAKTNVLIARSYETTSNFNQAIIYAFNAYSYIDDLDTDLIFEIQLLKSDILRALYMDAQSERYLKDAERLSNKIGNEEHKLKIILSKAELLLERGEFTAAESLLKHHKKDFEHLKDNETLLVSYQITKGKVISNLNEIDTAIAYHKNALSLVQKNNNLFQKSSINFELGKLYFLKKETQKSVDFFNTAIIDAEKINNTLQIKNINRNLITNYLALNDVKNYQSYSKEFIQLNNKIELAEQEAVNTAFNLISKEQEVLISNKSSQYSTYFWLTFTGVLIIVLVMFSIWLRTYMKNKRLTEILKYMEITRNVFSNEVVVKKDPIKKVAIPLETEQAILQKLKRFESSNKFISNDMSLAVLAGQFETNTKYLSEIINKHYQDNFNTYINKLRINFIIDKLKTDPNYMHYKISYLAEKCGFSSHSSFATVFKSITGIAPVTFIELLKEESNKSLESIEV